MKYAFRTYHKLNKQKLSEANILIIIVLTAFVVMILNNRYFHSSYIESIFQIISLTAFLLFLYLIYKSHNQKEEINNSDTGTLELLSDKIILNGKPIELKEIENLSIQAYDFDGKKNPILINTALPSISNGFNNTLNITLVSKKRSQLNLNKKQRNSLLRLIGMF